MSFYQEYSDKLYKELSLIDHEKVDELLNILFDVWKNKRRVFICGNGGSAANASHLANDFTYGVSPKGRGVDIEALSVNSSVVTCLANDMGYENIFTHQLNSKAKKNDVLIVLSGSGNSKNIVNVLVNAKKMGVITCAIVGYSGGLAKELADFVIHSKIDDMQIAEDIQVVVGHWLMRRLNQLILGE